MKTKLTLFILLCFAVTSPARFMKRWGYDDLKTNATLIVIAIPTQVSVTDERADLPGSNVAGKGLETTFEVLTVFKGEPATNTIVLHHFALAKPTQDGRAPVYTDSDPRLVAFEPKEKQQYLMFLKREQDGRYIAVSGQYDPVDSIHLLREGRIIPGRVFAR